MAIVSTDDITLINGAAIDVLNLSVQPTGGRIGSVTLQTQGSLSVADGSISASALNATGGAITIDAQQVLLSGTSRVNTAVLADETNAGDITFNTQTMALLDQSRVETFAAGLAGDGGDITINAEAFLIGRNAAFDTASRQGGNDGDLDNNAPEVDLDSALLTLDEGFASAEGLLGYQCRATARGSFRQRGPEGLAWRPEGLVEAFPSLDARPELMRAFQLRDRGQLRQALAVLETIDPSIDPVIHTAAANLKAAIALQQGRPVEAQTLWQQALEKARDQAAPALVASVLNNLGNGAHRQGDKGQAARYYAQSAQLAATLGEDGAELHAKAALNLARLPTATLAQRRDAWQRIQGLPPSQTQRRLVLAIAPFLAHPKDPVTRVSQEALEAGADATAAQGWGFLAQHYRQQGPTANANANALTFTQRALQAALRAEDATAIYHFQRQLAELYRAQGRFQEAIDAYQRALTRLEPLRPALLSATAPELLPVRQQIAQSYRTLADLLLQRAAVGGDAPQQRRDRLQARAVIEQLKSTELTDYFQDDCALALQARTRQIEAVDPTAAILYPIVFTDRVEVLISLADEPLIQVTLPVPADELTATVDGLRRRLEELTSRRFFPLAQALYQQLIAPLEAHLPAHIETLVFVPDGPLLTIPLAALHDGEQFLVERYAIATTPGLTLTDLATRLQGERARVLLGGLTEAVQGFPALPAVADEIALIEALYPTTTLLQDEGFRAEAFQRQLAQAPYPIVHIASHGQFAPRVEESFVLTYDDRLTLDRLDQLLGLTQFREQGVDLLVLSACQTAVGDQRAALGLAGIAVQAGARSALVSLWFISDEATALLAGEFYRALQTPGQSIAQ
ncbi:MAG: CHAT domain-containing protein, partial [Candidatus Competibacterales bacterium]